MTVLLCESKKAGDEMCLGILGGLGPMASAYFLELIVSMTDAKRDQDHPEIILINAPSVPDRTAFIMGKSSENPVFSMIQMGNQLKSMGASIIATPCITAHYFHRELQDGIGLPVIHAIRCCTDLLQQNGIKKVGLMATDGTVHSGIFQGQLKDTGIELILPSTAGQKTVMSIIYDCIKAGTAPDIRLFKAVHRYLRLAGAEVTLLGCTELSLLKKDHNLGDGILDAMEVLARECVRSCGKSIKPEYNNLFIPAQWKG